MKLEAKYYRTFDGREFAAREATECGINGYTVYVNSKGRKYAEFNVWALDVWGNKRDGFEVNDRSRVGVIMLPLDASTREILTALGKAGYLKQRIRTTSVTIDGDELNMHLGACRSGEPLLQLEVA